MPPIIQTLKLLHDADGTGRAVGVEIGSTFIDSFMFFR
jgi:hypothetical protein